jgi:hypothetical protein
MRRNNIDVGDALRWVNNKSQTVTAIVSATARRPVIFTTMPAGFAAVASWDIASSIPVGVRAITVVRFGAGQFCVAGLGTIRADWLIRAA